ncbi:MAG: hypothetical protein AAGF86_01825, partial [Pseudomonadota bacterium]
YLVLTAPAMMQDVMPLASWYVASIIIAPCGLVVQDAVADAMSVEAVPKYDENGAPLAEQTSKSLHTTMQTLGRFALISGLVSVAAMNIFIFEGVEQLSTEEKADVYAKVYLLAFIIPLVSITGALLAEVHRWQEVSAMRRRGLTESEIAALVARTDEEVEPNYWYFGGGLAFVMLTLAIGLSGVPFSQELVFAGSMTIVLLLMRQLLRELTPEKARALVGTAIIIFIFRAVPLPGAGATWFQIDVLGFDQQFLSILSLIASLLTLAAMIVLRPLMAKQQIVFIVMLLTVAAGILSLPNIGLYYGIQNWTAPLTGGVVDAHFIALIDTAVESPLGQIAMIPMLAWIAKNAPAHLKATFFAVMASFTNLALSASSLFTKHLNEVFVVTREVRDRQTNVIETAADYSELGTLLILAAVITVLAPLVAIFLVQMSRFRTTD